MSAKYIKTKKEITKIDTNKNLSTSFFIQQYYVIILLQKRNKVPFLHNSTNTIKR